MEYIATIQENVLLSLAKFRFLSLSQILELKVGTTQYKYLWKLVSQLTKKNKRRPLIDRIKFQIIDRIHRVEDLYFLTKYGVEYLISEGYSKDEILYPKNKPLSAKDYFHRKVTIDFQIAVYKWAEGLSFTVPLFQRYFDKSYRSNMSIARIPLKDNQYIIPDALFQISNDKTNRIFALEVHNGKNSNRIFKQVVQHVEGMLFLGLHKAMKYPLNRAYYVLILFTEESTLNSFLNRIQQNRERFQHIQEYILCKLAKDISKYQVDKGWLTILSTQSNFKI